MIIAALVFALAAFVALVFYIQSASAVALYAVWVAAAAGIVALIVDAVRKSRGKREP